MTSHDGPESGPSSGRDVEAIVNLGDRTVGRRATLVAAIIGVLAALLLKSWVFWLLVVAWPIYEFFARRQLLPAGDRGLARVQVSDTTLRILRDDRRPFERDHTRATRRQVWHRNDGKAVVELDWRGGDRVVIELADPARAEQLLRVGGARWNAKRVMLARGGLSATMSALTWLGVVVGGFALLLSSWWLIAVLFGYGGDDLTAVFAVLASSAFLWALKRAMQERWVVVGTDGLAFEGRSPEFVPYASLRSVERHPEGLALLVASDAEQTGALGERRVLRLRPSGVRPLTQVLDATTIFHSGRHEDALRAREELHDAIQAALSADRRAASAALAERLLRRGRGLETWQRDLGELKDLGGASYRSAAVEPEALASLVETAEAPLEARIAAAYAGSQTDDPALRRRFRIAEDATAEPALRSALALAGRGELAEALRAVGLESEAGDTRRSTEAERDTEALAEAEASEAQRTEARVPTRGQ